MICFCPNNLIVESPSLASLNFGGDFAGRVLHLRRIVRKMLA